MGIEAVSHGWDCRCARCEREAAWQAHDEPDERDSPWDAAPAEALHLDVARGCAPPLIPADTVAPSIGGIRAATSRHPAGLPEVRRA